MKKAFLSLALVALAWPAQATLVVYGGTLKGGGTTTTNNPDGSTTTVTTVSCFSADFVCAVVDCAVAPNGNPLVGSPVSLDIYQDGLISESHQGILQDFMAFPPQPNGTKSYRFAILSGN